MRVAVITRRFFRAGGGAETYAVALVRELATQHEVHVFSQQSDQPVLGAHYHPLTFWSERPRWLNQWVFALSSWWQTRRGFDVVHSHENTWHGEVQTIHVRPLRFNLLHGKSGWRRWWVWLKVALSPRLMTYLFLEAGRFAHRPGRSVVAASDLLRDECVRVYPGVKVEVVTPGADGPTQPQTRQQARQQLGWRLDQPTLLFVANDYARKGLATLLQALSQLDPSVHLAVVGSQNQIPTFAMQVNDLGLSDRVHFVGPMNDVSLAYQAADVLVHPTLEDSYAMVVLEAMAHGLPVIVSAFPWCGVSAQLTHGLHALLVSDPKDANLLAQNIDQVLHDDALRLRLVQAGQSFASEHDWSHAALEYQRFYEHARTHAHL